MTEPASPSTGLGVLHLFWKLTPATSRSAIEAAFARAQADGDQAIAVALLGHKADLGVMALSDDLWRLRRFQSELAAAGLDLASSYVSLTEVSEYAQGIPAEMREARLNPQLPPAGKPAWCFYPMSKRRNVGANWFALPYEERETLMREHGSSGRKFSGRILQLVTGSTGLDDHEWGVTLFAEHPDDLKAAVYTMRFDQASAHYGEFGTFYAGIVAELPDVLDQCGLAS